MWNIASVKKSIMFDVLGVMDRANRTNDLESLKIDYSLLKQETVEKFDRIYKAAIYKKDFLAAALYVPEDKTERHETILFYLLIEQAFEMQGFSNIVRWIKETTLIDFGYKIIAMCLSTERVAVSVEFVKELINDKQVSIIDYLNRTRLPERIKFSIYSMIYEFEQFKKELIIYLEEIYEEVKGLYTEFIAIYKSGEVMLKLHLQQKGLFNFITASFKSKTEVDIKQRKHIIILSLIRLEYSWCKKSGQVIYHVRGLFFLQRMIHCDKFTIF